MVHSDGAAVCWYAFDKVIDRFAQLADRRTAEVSQRRGLRMLNHLDHIQLAIVGGDEMKMHVGVPRQPTILFRLVCVEVVPK